MSGEIIVKKCMYLNDSCVGCPEFARCQADNDNNDGEWYDYVGDDSV